jgi:soluble lytic murein transglycosylase-like protein
MCRGFSAGNLLLSAICLSLANQAFAEEQPKTQPESEIIEQVEEVELAPLPVPRPGLMETVETEPGTGRVAFVAAGPAREADAVVTATSDALAPAAPDPADELRRLVAQQAEVNGVAAALADAVVTVESRYNPKARGEAGEIGLMQIKPDTARLLGFRGPDSALYHPATNVRWGMIYLAQAQRRGNGTVCGTILKYNAGHGAKAMNPISEAYCGRVKALLRGERA